MSTQIPGIKKHYGHLRIQQAPNGGWTVECSPAGPGYPGDLVACFSDTPDLIEWMKGNLPDKAE